MDGLELIKTFREVATRGSFTRAAMSLRISKASVSKYVAELEERFGVRLLNRSTRSVSLTDAGHLLLERSAPLIELVELTQTDLEERASRPRGRLRITAPHGVAQSAFAGPLGEFLARYPDVHVSLDLTNRVVDLVEEGVDIAIRAGRVRDQNLIVRRLRPLDMVLCATPAYWARRGLPDKPDDLRRHEVLTYSLISGAPHLAFEVDGQPLRVPVTSRMDANDGVPLVAAALQGLGVVSVPALLAQEHIDRGALVPVLQEFMPRDLWLYAAYTQRRHNSAALRALLDFLEARLARPAADSPTPAPPARAPARSRKSAAAVALSKK